MAITNMYDGRIYAIEGGGDCGIIFQDNSGGDNGWLIAANDRAGVNDPGGNALQIFDGNPDTLRANQDVRTYFPSTGNDQTPGDVNFVCSFGQDGTWAIGIDAFQYTLHVNGAVNKSGSSIEYKENVLKYTTDHIDIDNLTAKTFDYKEEYKHLGKDHPTNRQLGLIAEEVEISAPELAMTLTENDQQKTRNVDYEKLSVVLLCKYQELRKQLDQLKEQLDGN